MNMRLRAVAPKGMPRPSGDEGYKLLNSVWRHLAQTGRWPTFEQIDRSLYRDGIHFEHAVAQLPEGLVMGIDRDLKRRPPQTDQLIQLSLAGAVHCDDAAAEVKAFIGLVRLGGVVERDWEPAPDDPSAPSHPYIDPEVLGSHPAFDPGVYPPAEVLYRAAHLSVFEPWTSGLGFRPEELYWRVSFDRRIRPFAAVAGLAEYWKARTNVLPSTPPDPVFVQAPAVCAPVVAPPPELAFTLTIPLHPDVAAVAAERFQKGQHADAVFRAYQAVENRVQTLIGSSEVGTRLMGLALASDTPKLVVTRSTGSSLASEREGFQNLFRGAMAGLRNPRAHGPHDVDDPEEAQEMLVFASLLMRRLDLAEAELSARSDQVAGTP
ncbi:TIGR02391 family protein [Streptomyces torulosus]|uniref:TIGR02391 family protein n=1 Tax=Streptomyces torulosus TaxID=68276 RepID=UPI000AF0D3FE|nr:TIGR02391 family protein [Streptomyces torulosus]